MASSGPTWTAWSRIWQRARARLDGLRDLLANDPLVALARALPPTAADVRGADSVMRAAEHLFDAAEEGMAIGRRFVEIKEAQDRRSGHHLRAGPARGADGDVARRSAGSAGRRQPQARDVLAEVPEGLAGPIENARAAMVGRIDTYGPLLDSYLTASARLPAILGWDGPRRYLVLTQNPAELRPTGGYTGSYGIIAFDKGRITERVFRDIFLLDLPWDYPFIKAPTELTNYLLGPTQPWQLADANWSPDFPTSAQDAIRLYENESGDTQIDGVLGITTYTIDELLKVTGPITVPEYDATIATGETTLKTLQLTRVCPGPGRQPKGLPVGLRGAAVHDAPGPATQPVGRAAGGGGHLPVPAAPAGLVQGRGRRVVRRPRPASVARSARTPATSSTRSIPTWRRPPSSTRSRPARWSWRWRSTSWATPGTRWT